MNKIKDRLNKLKTDLYSRKTKAFYDQRSSLKKKKIKNDFQQEWSNETFDDVVRNHELYTYEKQSPSIFSIIFILSFIFFVIAIAFTFFYISFNKNFIDSNLNISILAPDSAQSGEIVDFIVRMENNTKTDYRDIELLIDFPESTRDAESGKYIKNKSIKGKDILAGGNNSERFSVIFAGAEGDKRDVKITFFYKAGAFSNVLSLSRLYTLEIDSAPVNLESKYPAKILANKEFEFEVNVISNASEILNDLMVIVNFPSGFKISGSNLEPVYKGTNQLFFKIDLLEPARRKSIKIKGILLGENNEQKFFRFEIGSADPFKNEIKTIFAKLEKEVLIRRSDLELALKSTEDNEQGETIVNYGDKINYEFIVKNNSPNLISDLNIETLIKGNLFDQSLLKILKGFYNSSENKITWNKNTSRDLLKITENSYWTDSLAIQTLKFKEVAELITNPEIKLNFKAQGGSFSTEGDEGIVEQNFSKIIKFNTVLDLRGNSYYLKGPFKNTGDVNPVVGEPTTYTIGWEISNFSSDVSDLEVRAKLPIYVKYLNNISPQNSYISYDENNREIIWKYKKVKALTGYKDDAKKVFFQLELTPSANQVGKKVVLIKDISLQATDDFTGTQIKKEYEDLTTGIEGDNMDDWEIGTVQAKE